MLYACVVAVGSIVYGGMRVYRHHARQTEADAACVKVCKTLGKNTVLSAAPNEGGCVCQCADRPPP